MSLDKFKYKSWLLALLTLSVIPTYAQHKKQKMHEHNKQSMPEFPGGNDSLMRFLRNNIRYPAQAREDGIQGSSIITFFVTETGEIDDIKIARNIPGSSFGKEITRVLKSMPNWIPANINGKPTKVLYTLPVLFKIRE